MKIFIERTQQSTEKTFEGRAIDLIKLLGMNVEELLIIKNSELVTENEDLTDTDEIKLLSVISGG